MPTDHGIGFDDLQRVQGAGNQGIESDEYSLSIAEEVMRRGDLRRSTFNWCRSTRFSACSDARDRNSPTRADQISLQKLSISREHQPIRAKWPDGLSFQSHRKEKSRFGELEAQPCHLRVGRLGGEGSKAFSMSFCAAI